MLGGAKLLLWHWSQPGAFLWLLYVFRGEVTALGPTQQSLAAVVATREVLGSTLLAVARKGSSCELSTGCDNNPCKNGGNCVADDGEHQCQCASGWTGETCDHATSLDDNPCGAHGRCTVQTVKQSCLVMKTHVLRRKSFGALNFFSLGSQLFLPGSPTFSLPRLAFEVVSW